MKPFSIIIPSRSIENLTACVAAIRAAGETSPIIVVDDFPGQGLTREMAHRAGLDLWTDTVATGKDPFVFSANINLGIAIAGTDDVILLNDDALLKTPKGFSILATQAAANAEYGAICPGFDYVGTPNLCNQGRKQLTDEAVMLVFACVFIPRRTIDLVGLLDERFGVNAGGPGKRGYGCEDDDYSWRIRREGLKLGVYDPVLVDHTTLKSTFRSDLQHPADVKIHEAVFEHKWGKHPRKP